MQLSGATYHVLDLEERLNTLLCQNKSFKDHSPYPRIQPVTSSIHMAFIPEAG